MDVEAKGAEGGGANLERLVLSEIHKKVDSVGDHIFGMTLEGEDVVPHREGLVGTEFAGSQPHSTLRKPRHLVVVIIHKAHDPGGKIP